jgi:2-polyprenyl-3-methyl-5-hydroxy-6-metoxy-1,4-benzoquinol methylase
MNPNYVRYILLKPFKSWKNKYLKFVTKKESLRLRLFDATVEEISQYTKEPREVVLEKYHLGPESEGGFAIFKRQTELCRRDVEEFYRRCAYYLYELPLWNAERNRPRYLALICVPYLKKNHYARVMDFGGGAGDVCIELARNKLAVSYCDIAEELFQFARWRFTRRKLSIEMIKGIAGIKDEYDCIVSFDAFEHIKDLPEILKQLARFIKPGGSLIFSGAFSGGTLHLEENERYNNLRELDTLMQACGLTFQDKFAQFYFYKKVS